MTDPSIKVSWSWAYQLVATIVAIALAYASLRSDLDITKRETHETAVTIEKTKEDVNTLKMNQSVTQQMLSDFRMTYERDMARYIRETPNR
jgi:hypothetical protein